METSIIIARDALKSTLQEIQLVLNERYDSSEGSNMLEYLEKLSYLLGNSSLAEASSKYWLECAKKKAISDYIATVTDSGRLQPMILKEYINACCAAELSAYTLAESQHSSLVHRIDAVRSALSYLKAEINNLNQIK